MSLPPPRDSFDNVPGGPRRQNRELNAAADSCRLLGILFVALGVLALLMFARPLGYGMRIPMWFRQTMAVVTTLVLIGPGAWYFVAARLVRRADPRAATISLIVISTQAALIVLGFAMIFTRGIGGMLVVPSVVGLFFLPALGAAAWHLVRARRAARSVARSHGFEPLAPKPVLPVKPLAKTQNESVRGK